jgi:hypothetical protein
MYLWWPCCLIDCVTAGVDDWLAIDVVDEAHQGFVEFVLGADADVPQYRARQLGKEPFEKVEPRPMGRREVKVKRPIGCAASQAVVSRDMGGMVAEDDLDRGIGRVGRVEEPEKINKFAAVWRSAIRVSRSIPAIRVRMPCRLYS